MSDPGDELWDYPDEHGNHYPPNFAEDYDDDRDLDDCDHEDADCDILTGRATCHRCWHAWWMTEAEIDAQIAHQRAYEEWQREQERPWNRFKSWVGGIVSECRLRWRLRPKRPSREPSRSPACTNGSPMRS